MALQLVAEAAIERLAGGRHDDGLPVRDIWHDTAPVVHARAAAATLIDSALASSDRS